MRRTREQALATRAAIVEAAQSVFYEYGVAYTSLSEIAERAGVTRGAVYWHFENKFALLDAIFQAARWPLDPFLVASVASCSGRADPVQGLLEELQRCWQDVTGVARNHLLCALVFIRCENARDAASLCQRVEAAARHSEQSIEQWLRYAMAQGYLPRKFDARTAANVIHATLSGLLRRQLMEMTSSAPAAIDVVGIVRALLRLYAES